MILSLIPDVIKLPIAVALGAAIAFYPAKWIGAAGERQVVATEALKTSVTVLRERNTINEEVTASDVGALCAALGLSDDETTECMRRLDEAPGEAGHSGIPHPEGSIACERDRQP
jgi:predicted amidohydrolase